MLWVGGLVLGILGRVEWLAGREEGDYVWKSATVALSPFGKGMNSWPAPLMTVRGTRVPDTDFTMRVSNAVRPPPRFHPIWE